MKTELLTSAARRADWRADQAEIIAQRVQNRAIREQKFHRAHAANFDGFLRITKWGKALVGKRAVPFHAFLLYKNFYTLDNVKEPVASSKPIERIVDETPAGCKAICSKRGVPAVQCSLRKFVATVVFATGLLVVERPRHYAQDAKPKMLRLLKRF